LKISLKHITIGFLLLFGILISNQIKSQYNYRVFNYFTAGVKGGYEIYHYNMDPKRSVEHVVLPNYSFGLTGGYYLRYFIEFHIDLLYANRDFTVKWLYPNDPIGDVPAQSTYKVNYLSFPMQARFNFVYTNWVKMNVGVGIMPEIRLKPHEIVTFQNGKIAESFDDFLTKDFRRGLFAFPLSLHSKFSFNRHYSTEISANYFYYVVKMNKILMKSPGYGYSFFLSFYYDW